MMGHGRLYHLVKVWARTARTVTEAVVEDEARVVE
jgi:hypothetical protein